jgi:predicted MFS family arabinose efflux permease
MMRQLWSIYKASYSGLSKSSWWLSAVMLINRSGTMVVPFMTLYLTQHKGYSIAQAGLVMGIFGAGAICGGLLGGRLTDRFGFYNVQLATLAGGGLMFILLGQMQSFAAICICTFVLALVNESFRPANSVAVAHYSKEENRTRSFSLNRLAINLGWAAGGSLGGFIAAHNYNLLFIIDGLTNISAAILLSIYLKPAKAEKPLAAKKKTANSFEVYRDFPYLLFILLTLMFSYSFFQLFTTLPIYFRKNLQLSEEFIGVNMALNGVIIAVFEMVLVYKLEGKRHPLQYIPLGAALVALSYFVFNFVPGAVVVALLSMLLITIGEMSSMPFMNTYWISRTNDENRGQYAGLYTVAWASAQVLGPATGAGIAEKYGFTTLWWTIGGIAVLAALGFFLLHRYETAEREAFAER